MLKELIFLTSLVITNALVVTKMSSEVTVYDMELLPDEHLDIKGVKKTSKGRIEHILIKNCSGVIDDKTFEGFSKLNKLTIWKSNIKEIRTTLPITRLMVVGSHFPNLDEDLQKKLPHLQNLLLIGNKNFEVNPSILKDFKKMTGLYISEANFTEDCVTKDWFKGMDSLTELGISDNKINCITDDAFNSLKTLQKLDLTFNKIQVLEKKTFKKLTKLEKLGLYENDIGSIDLSNFASQKNHLEALGISWNTLQNSYISVEGLIKAFPKLKWVSFGHQEPHDFKAGIFCQKLRENGVTCDSDNIFGISKILGYSIESCRER